MSVLVHEQPAVSSPIQLNTTRQVPEDADQEESEFANVLQQALSVEKHSNQVISDRQRQEVPQDFVSDQDWVTNTPLSRFYHGFHLSTCTNEPVGEDLCARCEAVVEKE